MRKANGFLAAVAVRFSAKFWDSIVFSVLIASLYTIAVIAHVSSGWSDFLAHAIATENILKGEGMPPHFLYQFFLIAIHSIDGIYKISFIQASFVVVFFLVFGTAIVAHKNIIDINFVERRYIGGAAVLFLLLSHPIAILFFFDNHLYYGYIASNVYHNPSILLLKFVALSHFILLCKLLNGEKNTESHIDKLFLLALLTGLTIIAKPNYIIALLPALLILYLVKIFRSYPVSRKLLAISLSVIIPAIILLGWQYIFFYGSSSPNTIGVSFLEVYEAGSLRWTLIPKLVLSLAFPISVIIAAGRNLTKRIDFQLSVSMLIISLFYSYLLVDNVGGKGTAAGNFWWSAQISHFLLLFVCIKFYVKIVFGRSEFIRTKKAFLPVYMGVAQFAFGLIWYLSNAVPVFWRP